jgi:hypothetical protein
MYGEGGNFDSYFTNDTERTFMKRLLKELCSTKLHNWSFHRNFYLNKIVLRRSYKLLPACVVYSTGSSFISGYSLSSGRFLSAHSNHLYVAGSPRNYGSRGRVSNLKKCTAPRRGYTSMILLHNLFYVLHILPLSPIFLYLIDGDMAYFEGKYKVTFLRGVGKSYYHKKWR